MQGLRAAEQSSELRQIRADKHNVTSALEAIDSDPDSSDLEEALPECPLTTQLDVKACVDISDTDDNGEDTHAFSFLVPGMAEQKAKQMAEQMADGGANELMALADEVMDCKAQKVARQQDRASRRRQQKKAISNLRPSAR